MPVEDKFNTSFRASNIELLANAYFTPHFMDYYNGDPGYMMYTPAELYKVCVISSKKGFGEKAQMESINERTPGFEKVNNERLYLANTGVKQLSLVGNCLKKNRLSCSVDLINRALKVVVFAKAVDLGEHAINVGGSSQTKQLNELERLIKKTNGKTLSLNGEDYKIWLVVDGRYFNAERIRMLNRLIKKNTIITKICSADEV